MRESVTGKRHTSCMLPQKFWADGLTSVAWIFWALYYRLCRLNLVCGLRDEFCPTRLTHC